MSEPKERPILMSAPMVRAILAGTKTQTRRPIKLKHHHTIEERDDGSPWPWMYDEDRDADWWMPCPLGAPGDGLWVCEQYLLENRYGSVWCTYAANMQRLRADGAPAFAAKPGEWRQSNHMPRWASRIDLLVKRVWVEQLQDISTEDAMAEGVSEINASLCGLGPCMEWRYSFEDIWKSIYGPESWDENPWVWCCEFERVKS